MSIILILLLILVEKELYSIFIHNTFNYNTYTGFYSVKAQFYIVFETNSN